MSQTRFFASVSGGLIFYFQRIHVLFLVGYCFLLTVVCLLKRIVLVIWLIKLYQIRASAEVGLRCKNHPSFSEYMILALKNNGVINEADWA